jgi:hypothetical protein
MRDGSLALFHLDELVGHQAVRFAVNGGGRLLVGRFDQAKDLARFFVEPVAPVVDAVLRLGLQIRLVGLLDGIGGQAFDVVVNIHEQRHFIPPFRLLTRTFG